MPSLAIKIINHPRGHLSLKLLQLSPFTEHYRNLGSTDSSEFGILFSDTPLFQSLIEIMTSKLK